MRTRARVSQVMFIAAILVAAACAHKTRIVTDPPGARVFVGDQFTCSSPCVYRTPATQLKKHTPIRIEQGGYETVRSELKTSIMAKRIVAGIFTLGVVPLFRWPYTYQDTHRFTLRQLTYGERLADLDARRRDGRISEDEYLLLRRNLLGQP